jgi:hypothetical protein
MKKIMFNDRYGLTKAVLEGRKTQTRRVITYPKTFHGKDVCGYYVCRRATDRAITEVCMYDENESFIDEGQILPKYKVGEVVAVAQSYCSIAEELENCKNATCAAHYENNVQKASEYIWRMEHPGFNNKMFVDADMMIHQIRITNVRIESLQDISDEDCLAEGIIKCDAEGCHNQCYLMSKCNFCHCGNAKDTPREAYSSLIDKVSGKGTWENNPYVFVYDFELVD